MRGSVPRHSSRGAPQGQRKKFLLLVAAVCVVLNLGYMVRP